MPISLGFDDQQRHTSQAGGLFGMAAALASPARRPGIGGVLGAIADPGNVMANQYRNEAQQRYQTLHSQLEPQMLDAMAAMQAGDNATADKILYGLSTEYIRNGIDPEKAMKPLLDARQNAEVTRMRSIDPTSPGAIGQVFGYSRTPAEGANILQAGAGMEASRAQMGESQARTGKIQQETQQGQALFPMEQEKARLGNIQTEAQTGLTRQQTATSGAQAGLYGEQAGQERLLTDYMTRNKGLNPAQVGETERATRTAAQTLYKDMTEYVSKGLKAGESLFGTGSAPTVEQAEAGADAMNRRAEQLGIPERVLIDRQEAIAGEKDPRTGDIVGGKEAGYQPRIGAQEEYGRRQMARQLDTLSDDKILDTSFDEQNATPQDLQERQQLQQEVNAETARMTDPVQKRAHAANRLRAYLKKRLMEAGTRTQEPQ